MAAGSVVREEILNRLLRRADWRFLLPNPQAKKSICFGNDGVRNAVCLISDQVADAQRGSSGDCDLAVAVNPIHTTLQTCWAALRPGGSCYTEWYSPLAGGAKGARRRLERAGFEDVNCYWAWPWPSLARSRFWLPLNAPGALRHFLISRPPARGAVRRIGNRILRIGWILSLRMNLLLPVCAIARKPVFSVSRQPATAGPNAVPAPGSLGISDTNYGLLDKIRAGWNVWGLGPTPERLSSLVQTGGHRSVGKVVSLVFAEPDHRPRLAVKMARVPDAVAGLAREAATLQALWALPSASLQGVPRVLFSQEYAGFLALGETALVGQPLSTIVKRDNYRKLALKVTDWLASFAGRAKACPPASWWNRLVEPALANFIDSFGPVVDPGMLRETQDILATLGPLPLVCEQRDFGPWNVMMTATGELGVLDWESSEPHGLPAMDLVYALSYLAFFREGVKLPSGAKGSSGRFAETYGVTLNADTLTGSVRSECLSRYASQVGLDPASLHPLALLVWIVHSRSEYRHFTADVAGKPDRETLRHSLFLSLWEEELRHGRKMVAWYK